MPLDEALGGHVLEKKSTDCLSFFLIPDRQTGSTSLVASGGSTGSRLVNRTSRTSSRPYPSFQTTKDSNSACAFLHGKAAVDLDLGIPPEFLLIMIAEVSTPK
jgi:hypothetical protein